jgi:hypothetical protein
MTYGSFAAINAGTQAARERQIRLEREEEELAYTSDDLNSDWEFKIVRGGIGAFRKPQVFKQLIEEEARAGWVMLEKLDDSRVRFKRPRRARVKDTYLPPEVDPYRTQYGSPTQTKAFILMVALSGVLLALGIAGFIVFMLRMGR